ncbi:MAG TPA: hypothetical protein VFD77_05395 [Brumimicrobium sp.]|nr:hypothetical protein [Brumimicrobium sp.]
MKRLIYTGAFLLLGTIALSSCKKDWTCICGDGEYDTTTIKNQTKSKAKKICEGTIGFGPINTATNNCYIN